jgi:ABC-type sugar transport system substrate-binding protein
VWFTGRFHLRHPGLSAADPGTDAEPIDAAAAGIPVITIDSDSPKSNV